MCLYLTESKQIILYTQKKKEKKEKIIIPGHSHSKHTLSYDSYELGSVHVYLF